MTASLDAVDHIEALHTNFPDAVPLRRYLTRLRDVIEPLGFERTNTLTMVSLCRDELAEAMISEFRNFWEQPFDLGGLAGLPPVGTETWQVALSHIPDAQGRGKLLVLGASHIGIAPDGTLGRYHRHGQSTTTTACGALDGFRATVAAAGPEGLAALAAQPVDAVQTETARLTQVLLRTVDPAIYDDLKALTIACAEAINSTAWNNLDLLEAHSSVDIAVFCGVQIHLHDDADQILPVVASYKGADGRLVPLEIG